jgi:hypothetical protein
LPACAQELREKVSGAPMVDLSQMVVVGDSLSASFQNGSLLAGTRLGKLARGATDPLVFGI